MPPTLLVQLPFLTLRVFLCLDPSPPWDLFSALAHILICCLILSPSVFKLDADSGFVNHEQGTHIAACAVSGVYLLMLAKPLRNFKYIGNGEGSMQSDKAWWEEYLNVVCIPYSPRLIGWSHQVKNIPPSPQQSRRSFVLRSTLRAARYMIFFEVGQLYVWYNPAYYPAVIGTQSYAAQCINAAAFVGLSYWTFNAVYYAAAAGSVAIGLYHPRMWPNLFGAWQDAYTVRRFWGQTWHQMLRGFLSPLGKATSTALGFKPGTIGSSYTQLYVAFFLSGLIHVGGDIALSFRGSAASPSLPSMRFFLLQAFIITLEDMLICVTRRFGVKHSVWTRILGYAWVTAWLGWCVSEFAKTMVREGGGIRQPGVDENAMESNLVQSMLGFFGFDVGAFAECWFSKA